MLRLSELVHLRVARSAHTDGNKPRRTIPALSCSSEVSARAQRVAARAKVLVRVWCAKPCEERLAGQGYGGSVGVVTPFRPHATEVLLQDELEDSELQAEVPAMRVYALIRGVR